VGGGVYVGCRNSDKDFIVMYLARTKSYRLMSASSTDLIDLSIVDGDRRDVDDLASHARLSYIPTDAMHTPWIQNGSSRSPSAMFGVESSPILQKG